MEFNTFIHIIIFIFIGLIGITLFYQWKIRTETNYSLSKDNTEQILLQISNVLNGIQESLRKKMEISGSEKYLVIDLAKSELEKSSLLIDKLQNIVGENNINNEQLEKLVSIDEQMRSINNILSSRYKSK